MLEHNFSWGALFRLTPLCAVQRCFLCKVLKLAASAASAAPGHFHDYETLLPWEPTLIARPRGRTDGKPKPAGVHVLDTDLRKLPTPPSRDRHQLKCPVEFHEKKGRPVFGWLSSKGNPYPKSWKKGSNALGKRPKLDRLWFIGPLRAQLQWTKSWEYWGGPPTVDRILGILGWITCQS